MFYTLHSGRGFISYCLTSRTRSKHPKKTRSTNIQTLRRKNHGRQCYRLTLVAGSTMFGLFGALHSSPLGTTNWTVICKWYFEEIFFTGIWYGCMELGGTLAAVRPEKLAVQLSVAVFATTLHCQDFKDVDGDRLMGRHTLPMICVVGARFILYRTVEADKQSCKYYSVWLSLHHLLPGYWNYFHDSTASLGIDLLQTAWETFSGSFIV
ncbi:hypothetical protein BU15DRAFT_62665 [Melanogaster broomeanus]|nr:hypothetical protein BU15DRAFT_62665 [Melanogaster broomeanus]